MCTPPIGGNPYPMPTIPYPCPTSIGIDSFYATSGADYFLWAIIGLSVIALGVFLYKKYIK